MRRAAGGQERHHLAGGCVTMQLPLREDQHAVARHLEDAATSLEQIDPGFGVPFANLGRQTDGPWFVVSDDAIADGDVHGHVDEGEHLSRRTYFSGWNYHTRQIRQLPDNRIAFCDLDTQRIDLLLEV